MTIHVQQYWRRVENQSIYFFWIQCCPAGAFTIQTIALELNTFFTCCIYSTHSFHHKTRSFSNIHWGIDIANRHCSQWNAMKVTDPTSSTLPKAVSHVTSHGKDFELQIISRHTFWHRLVTVFHNPDSKYWASVSWIKLSLWWQYMYGHTGWGLQITSEHIFWI